MKIMVNAKSPKVSAMQFLGGVDMDSKCNMIHAWNQTRSPVVSVSAISHSIVSTDLVNRGTTEKLG